jgi:hypothetical protein
VVVLKLNATPPLNFTPDVLHMMANISTLVNAGLYLSIPFNDTTANLRLAIAAYGEAVLGNTLFGFQVGNEPDPCADQRHRNNSYVLRLLCPVGVVVDALASDTDVSTKNWLIAPSVPTATGLPS